MSIRYLDEHVAVTAQVAPDALAALRAGGIATIICNRPDGEGAGQPGFDAIAGQARACGMVAHYLPVVPGQITEADVQAFAALVATAPKPVLAYCRTGQRAETLWQRSAALRQREG